MQAKYGISTLLHCCSVVLLLCCIVAVLRCCSVVVLQLCVVAMLQCCVVIDVVISSIIMLVLVLFDAVPVPFRSGFYNFLLVAMLQTSVNLLQLICNTDSSPLISSTCTKRNNNM